MSEVDLSWVVPISEMKGEDRKDARLLKRDAEYARDFIETRPWCRDVHSMFFGYGVGGVASVFLFHAFDARDQDYVWVWVIQGDVPAAEVRDVPTPVDAFRAYIQMMREWVAAAESGASVDHLVPVNVPPTYEHAEALAGRLDFLEENFLENYFADGE